MRQHLDRITVVLNRPQQPGNVGSVARAMMNTGLNKLRLVAPCDHQADMARWMAVRGRDILAEAQVFEALAPALADCHLVVGTVPRNRERFRFEAQTPRQLAHRLLSIHTTDRIGLLFGREDSGLSNRELDLCQEFVSIPTSAACHSLNLSHAFMVIAYELFLAASGSSVSIARPGADTKALEGMYRHMEQALASVGFLNGENPAHIMRDIRRIFGRARLDEREVRILRGICRQMLWAASRKRSAHSETRFVRKE